MFKVLNDRILTFEIKGASISKGGIYLTSRRSGHRDYFDCAPVWIAQIGPKSELDVEPGQTGLILDHFELEAIPGVWDEYKDDPRFALLKNRCEEVDGYVETSIMSATAIIMLLDLCEPSEAEHTISFGDGELRPFGVK